MSKRNKNIFENWRRFIGEASEAEQEISKVSKEDAKLSKEKYSKKTSRRTRFI